MEKLLLVENKAALMTPDKKCILRGTGSDKELCLLDEKSNKKLMLYKSIGMAEAAKDGAYIHVSEKVKELYNITSGYKYNKDKCGELIAVEVKCDFTVNI